MGSYAVIDTDLAPIVRVQVVGEPSDENYQEYLDDLGAAFRALPRFAMLFNTGSLGNLPSRYRDQQTDWLAQTQAEFRGRWIASAFIIKSPNIRGVLHTMFWIRPPHYLHKVTSDQREGHAWLEDKLRDAGVELQAPSNKSVR